MSAPGKRPTPAQLDSLVRFLASAPATAAVAAARCAMPDAAVTDAMTLKQHHRQQDTAQVLGQCDGATWQLQQRAG